MDSVFLNGKTRFMSIMVSAGQDCLVETYVTDFDGDTVTYRTEILEEKPDYYLTGGDHEKRPATIETGKYRGPDNKVRFKAPAEPGPYRLFVYALDGRNHAATANIPFLVKP
ncbi:MAG: hypothetical protein HC896_13600 [Bacteroidales bacterium]|nr:hypothetical protein [Bacteroidales bacterium]